MLERTINAPAARGLVDEALDFDHAVGRLVGLGVAPARSELDLAEAQRAAVGVEPLQRLLGGAATHRVGRFLNRRIHLQQAPLKAHRNRDRYLVARPSTCAMSAPSQILIEGYRILLEKTSYQGRATSPVRRPER